MDKHKIRPVLQDALEEEIPSSQVRLWPAVKASLVAGEHKLVQQGENMNATKPQRVPRFAYAILAGAVLMALAIVTHSMPIAERMGRVLELRDGVLASGSRQR